MTCIESRDHGTSRSENFSRRVAQASRFLAALVACLPLQACSAGGDASEADVPATRAGSELESTAQASEYPVGVTRLELEVAPGRKIPVRFWYPAVESARAAADAGRSVLEFEPPGPNRTTFENLMRTAGTAFTQRTMHAAESPAAAALDGRFPLVLVSHCDACLGFGYFTIAERLARHGFVVAAPDHVNNTLYDALVGKSTGLDVNVFIDTRRKDILAVTDFLLDAHTAGLPPGLAGRIDPDKIGMMGHSFGAITASYASTLDPRIKAIALLAMIASLDDEFPYVGPALASGLKPLTKPMLFVRAREDAIAIFGLNDLIQSNFDNSPAEAWMATLADTGHYSVTDLCGIHFLYTNGCGIGIRATRFLQPLTFLDIGVATRYTGQFVTTYFEQQLLGGSTNTMESVAGQAPNVITLQHRLPLP
jgi:dienelactone hydrolase